MQAWSTAHIAKYINGKLLGSDISLSSKVVIDSRVVSVGSLFIAIRGETHDGHEFLSAAISAGAAAVVVDHQCEVNVPQIVVTDTSKALTQLAKQIVSQAHCMGMISVALTGSSGKTSTKDLLAQILGDQAPTVAPHGSLNNEIGVPLTVCRIDESTRYLVSELGARGIGHIQYLTEIVSPDIALVLNVGVAHLGEFGAVEETAQAKGEIIESLTTQGWAILNADDERVAAMSARTCAQIGWFATGIVPKVDAELVVCALNVTLDELSRPSFSLRFQLRDQISEYPVKLSLLGEHQAANAAAAAAVAVAAGIAPSQVAYSLNRVVAQSAWRMALTVREDDVLIINDAYNANPDSMCAALASLTRVIAGSRKTYPNAKGYAVIGDMLELGPAAAELHYQVGAKAELAEVIAVGDYAESVVAGAASIGVVGRVASKDQILTMLNLSPGDVVLIKGSRALGLESIADALIQGASR